MRKIESVYAPHETHWVGNGFRVHNFIPSGFGLDMKRIDPFILLDYNAKMSVSPSDTARGVGAHPYRGFETVTIAYEGKVEHHDSFGGGGVIGTGDVQWMSAASGVLHKEFYESGFNKTGGDFCMVQLWVNLASEFKMSEPKYQAITNDKMGVYDLSDGGRIEVIAGEYKGVKGAARTYSPVHLMNAKLKSD
ncbi:MULTISPECIES: pirin family protein [Campylobacter]|uniref:pirin family protein n=1 Tax=Campylobacter TaxID=194 RepID=UPI00027A390D|nr:MULTISPECIES: pirin family protein [Campylobacter]EJP75198.1 pirin family protein [Campylobacter sp. FOBRC14]MBN7288821.1 pirin family protein [Campylobacter curvus]MDU6826895.1 pirin family protein [Campylobacter sp.]